MGVGEKTAAPEATQKAGKVTLVVMDAGIPLVGVGKKTAATAAA